MFLMVEVFSKTQIHVEQSIKDQLQYAQSFITLKAFCGYHFLSVKSLHSFPCTASVDFLQQQSETPPSSEFITARFYREKKYLKTLLFKVFKGDTQCLVLEDLFCTVGLSWRQGPKQVSEGASLTACTDVSHTFHCLNQKLVRDRGQAKS